MDQPVLSCLDCGAPLQGPFCAQCGQKASDTHRSVFRFLGDFCRDIFNVEAKLVQTLKHLVALPGELTRAFIEGKRTRYVTPLKLYLFISVLFFFLRTVVFQPDTDHMIANVKRVTDRMTDSLVHLGETEAEAEEIRREIENNKVITKMLELREQERLAPFMVRFFNRIPTLMFLMMPLFALVLRLLYIRLGARFYYLEHLIFSLHTHAVFFLIGAFMVLLPSHGLKFVITAAIVAVYTYLAMHRVYGQSHLKTMAKWALLVVIYGFMSLVATGLLMIASLANA